MSSKMYESIVRPVSRSRRNAGTWKSNQMSSIGRATMVNAVLSAIPIYLLVVIDAPKWVVKGIDKIRRGFLWAGKAQANGGCCRVAWSKVCAPKNYGGLGVPNLELMGIALRSRWTWLQRTSSSKPWQGLAIPGSQKERNFVAASTVCQLRDGQTILFWEDSWLQEGCIRSFAPNIYDKIPPRVRRCRTVAEALTGRQWIKDIRGALGIQPILEYLKLWSLVQMVDLDPTTPDSIIWKWESSGQYSSKSAYKALFSGRVTFLSTPIWKSLAPPRCCFFLWLVAINRCWTADRLRSRGLPHPDRCVLCDQYEESIDHILVACPESRQLWWWTLQAIRRPNCLPVNEPSFHNWLCESQMKIGERHRRGFDTVVTLVA